MNRKRFTRPVILLAAALAFAACSNEDVQVDNPMPTPTPTDGKMMVSITAAMDEEGRGTRSSFVYGTDLDGTGEVEKFQWEAGDKINLRFSKQDYENFSKNILSAPDDLKPGHSSTTFSGEINKYFGQQTVYAVSPIVKIGVPFMTGPPTKVSIDYPLSVTQKGTDLSHLGKTDYMWARAENFNVGEDEENPLKGMKLNFEHLGAMLRFQIKNIDEEKKYTLQSVTVKEESTSQLLWNNATFDLADEKPLLKKNSYSNNPKTVEIEGADKLGEGKTFDAYMMVPASYDKDLNLATNSGYRFIVEVVVKEDETEKKLIRTIEIDPKDAKGKFLNNGFEAGMRYYFVISVNEGKLQGYYKEIAVTAGGLSSLIQNKDEIERLKLTGTINRQDFVFLNGMKNLYDLDLSEVTIEEYKDEDVTYPANTIPKDAFLMNTSLRYITLPKNLEAIGENAFNSCSGLTGDLTIPEGVTTIGNHAFNGCAKLTGDLIIPKSVTIIGKNAFNYNTGLTGDLIIPEGVTTIDENAFSFCSGFTGKLTISNTVDSIGKNAFNGCSGFTGALKLPVNENFKTIGENAFNSCSGFTGDLIIPNSVITIGNQAFLSCSGFTGDLTIPDNVITIGNQAFFRCSGFTGDLIIPDNVITINNQAFEGCSGFSGDLTIPKTIKEIGTWAFLECQFSKINLYWKEDIAILPYDRYWYLPDVTTTVPKGMKGDYESEDKKWKNVVERDK